MSAVDWIIVAGYGVISLLIGLYYARRAGKDTESFFLSGRGLPWWIIGTSMVATTFAADTPLAVTEMVRGHGIWKNWLWWCFAFSHVLAVVFFSRLWRRARVLTDNELLEIRYTGKRAAFLRGFKATYFATIYNFIVMAWVINAMGTVVAAILPIPVWLAITICSVLALFYAVLSGFWGVVYTDLLQFAVSLGGAVVLAVFAVDKIGGIDALTTAVRASERLPELIGSPSLAAAMALGPATPLSWGGMLAMPVAHESLAVMSDTLSFFPDINGPGFFPFMIFLTVFWWSSHNADGGGYIIQRMSAARDERHSRLATLWFCIAHYALRVWPWILVALVSLVMYPTLSSHKEAYPSVMMSVLPDGLKGLMVASFLGAFMSTIDTHLNWGASYIVNDIYRRFMKRKASEKHYVMVSRLTSIAVMIVAAVCALFVKSISSAWILVWSMGAGIGLVLILRWFWWRINAYSEIAALSASLLAAIPLSFLNLEGHIRILLVVPFAMAVWIPVTLFTKPEPKAHLLAFYHRVRPRGWWAPILGMIPDDDPSGSGETFLWYVGEWIAGIALIYGLMFGLGKLLLGEPLNGLISLLFAAAGGSFLAFRWRRKK